MRQGVGRPLGSALSESHSASVYMTSDPAAGEVLDGSSVAATLILEMLAADHGVCTVKVSANMTPRRAHDWSRETASADELKGAYRSTGRGASQLALSDQRTCELPQAHTGEPRRLGAAHASRFLTRTGRR